MPLSHNQPFKLLDSAYGLVAGLYRMVIADPRRDIAICVLIRPENPMHKRPGGRPVSTTTKRPNQTQKRPQVGALSKISHALFQELIDNHDIVLQSLELPSCYYYPLSNQRDQEAFDQRCRIMQEFLDFTQLRESLLVYGNLGGLIQQSMEKHSVSESYVRRLWSILCTYGFTTTSLRPRWDRCGARGEKRNLSPDSSRQKAGRKTSRQRLNKALYGTYGQPNSQA